LSEIAHEAWPVTQHASIEYEVSGISLRAQSVVRRDPSLIPRATEPADTGPDAWHLLLSSRWRTWYWPCHRRMPSTPGFTRRSRPGYLPALLPTRIAGITSMAP